MRIIIIGSDYDWSIERIFKRELILLGCDVEIIPVQNWFNQYYYNSLFNKILFRCGLSRIYKKINSKTKHRVDQYNPRVIWVFKGMEISPLTLINWRNNGYLLINFNPDNPFVFTGKGSGNSNVTNAVSLFDVYLTYDRQILELLNKKGIAALLFPFAFDSLAEFQQYTGSLVRKLAFVANPDKMRVRFLNELDMLGIPIEVYGNNWHNTKLNKNISVFGAVDKIEYLDIAQRNLAMINIMRVHNLNSHNMRTFEIPGYRGIQIAPATSDHLEYFTNGEDIFLFNNHEDILEIWKELNSYSEIELQRIRNNAREKVVLDYSYSERAKEFLKIVNELLNK